MRNLLITMFLAVLPAAAADIYTFTVPDAVTVSSLAGFTTGWGYSLHNDSTSLWLVTTDLSAGTFQHATPDLLFDFPDIAPGATVTVPYDPVTGAGLYQIVWDTDTPASFINSGTFNLMAQWWNGDPVAGGSFVQNAPNASQSYSATITPEPATVTLMALAGLLLAIPRAFRRRGEIRRLRT